MAGTGPKSRGLHRAAPARLRPIQDQAADALARAGIGPAAVVGAFHAAGVAIDSEDAADGNDVGVILFRLGLILVDRDNWRVLHDDRHAVQRHLADLLDILPRLIRDTEAHTGSEAYLSRGLLVALQPFVSLGNSWPDRRGWWHRHARELAVPVGVVLRRHGRPVGWANATAPAVKVIAELLRLAGVLAERAERAVVAALRPARRGGKRGLAN